MKTQKLLLEFQNVFSETLGKFKNKKVKLELEEDAKPVLCKARSLPYALKAKVEEEIKRLVCEGILVPVKDSEWATPIVPVIKSNGQVRICGDFKITLNPNLRKNRHPIPRIPDLLSRIENGVCLSKIDLSDAYLQLELVEESRELVVINMLNFYHPGY
ncbi:uncharacterized protein K02A2.6-like [Microplitis mediator]|uniref:uncharacterized protein K02A2.6-like n=1 Tax=Microplitis mediator TaxID=375433 RepID=UPI0025575A87|nr:uncharacterized protein K02A2.6-like [Microplitis mediator]